MRDSFIAALTQHAAQDESIFLLTGDLGYSVLEDFQARFPERFLNAGVAEQNMIGVAAGLAKSGFHVFVYSIGNFLSFRAIEQIRNDVYYPSAKVTLVGVGGGFDYGAAGFSHWMIEDLAPLSALESLPIFVPSTDADVRNSVGSALMMDGPSYLRLARATRVPMVSEKKIRSVTLLIEGQNNAVVSYGSLLSTPALMRHIENSAVIGVDHLHPLDVEALKELLSPYEKVTIIEDHVWAGGLGSRLSKLVSVGQLNLAFDWVGIDVSKADLSGGTTPFLLQTRLFNESNGRRHL